MRPTVHFLLGTTVTELATGSWSRSKQAWDEGGWGDSPGWQGWAWGHVSYREAPGWLGGGVGQVRKKLDLLVGWRPSNPSHPPPQGSGPACTPPVADKMNKSMSCVDRSPL